MEEISGVMHSSRIALNAFGVFFPEKTCWRNIGGVLFFCCSKTTHSDALLRTIFFLSMTYFMGWSEGVPYIFDTKDKGENSRSSGC